MATCGPSNAATQMNKLVNTDKSLQHEHAVNAPQPNSMGLRGERLQLSQNDRQRLENMQRAPDPFQFDQLRQNIPPYAAHPAHPAHPLQPTHSGTSWAQEFRQSPAPVSVPAAANPNWASEFIHSNSSSSTSIALPPTVSQPMFMGTGMGGYMTMGPPMAPSMMGAPHTMMGTAAPSMAAQSDKWDAAFESLEKNMDSSVKDANLDSKTEVVAPTVQADSSSAKTDTTTASTSTKATAEQKVSEFTEQMMSELMAESEEEEILDTESMLHQPYPPNWDQMWDGINNPNKSAAEMLNEDFASHFSNYKFEENNPYRNEDDPYEMGVYYMDNGAKLSTAVLCFEEAVRRDPHHIEAWVRLGMAQAQNEVENQAIIALEKALALNPIHERALLNLAISYTNEGYDAAASQLLSKWITAKYPQIAESVPPAKDESSESLHARVTNMFLKAATRPGPLDADVQVGLGVLCYRNDDYGKAVDCFKAALSENENDPSLWNRLGATLANARRPEEAIEAYERALRLRPSFVRARYNLAVSCINIGCYREAAEHLLSALSLHETEEQKGVDLSGSSSLVDTLRRVFFAMDRRDLLVNLQQGADLSIFRNEFNF